MKNPSKKVEIRPGATDHWSVVMMGCDDGIHSVVMHTRDAKWLYDAINQHDELVAMLKKHEWQQWNTFAGQRCPECLSRRPIHKDNCKLAALLAEEDRET
jgi:hypothetical protein